MKTIKPDHLSPEQWCRIIDVRSLDEYLQEHIPDSRCVPLETLSTAAAELKDHPEIILSCRSGNRARQAAEQLTALGCTNIQLLDGGLMGWKSAKQPTRSLQKGYSIMQQVQIIAGSMILAGSFYQPLWFLAPLAGAGLLIARTHQYLYDGRPPSETALESDSTIPDPVQSSPT